MDDVTYKRYQKINNTIKELGTLFAEIGADPEDGEITISKRVGDKFKETLILDCSFPMSQLKVKGGSGEKLREENEVK